MDKINWKCYVCGKPIEKKFTLVSMNKDTDRPFIVHTDCTKRLEEVFIVVVRKV